MNQTFSHRRVILFLGIINALTPFTIDLYLPAFGDIASDLNTQVSTVSLTVATYFVGYAIGQLLYGPLLDRFGRKKPVYMGLGIYLIAGIGCMTAQSIEALLFFRFLSALGGCAASVAAVAMVRDFFDPKEGARVFSLLMLVLSVSPLFAPTIGGWIALSFGWRMIFAALTGLALIDLLIVRFGLPEVFTGDKEMKLRPTDLWKGFVDIAKVPEFRTYALAGAFSFSGLFVYLTGSPSIFIEEHGLSKQEYGYVFAFLAVAMIGGSQVNNQLMKIYESTTIYRRVLLVQMILSSSFLVAVLLLKINLLVTIAFFFAILLAVGTGYPNAASLAMSSFSLNAGRASALLGFIQMGVGAVLAAVVGAMKMSGTFPTAFVLALSSLIAWLIIIGSRKSIR